MMPRAQLRLKQAERWLKYRFLSHGLILVYHRVTDLPNDPSLLAVNPQRFTRHMEILRSFYKPLPLHQLVYELHEKKITHRAVAITFDDGYADNYQQAKPILEKYEIPATVFVTAGHIGSQREFWWDELDRLVLQPGPIPNRLSLCIQGEDYRWENDKLDQYSMSTFQGYGDWHIEREDNPHPRHRLFREIYDRIHSLPEHERQRVLDGLRTWIGIGPNGRESHRSLTQEEVILLEQAGLVEVGDHTMVHSDLAALPVDEQRQEIQQSKDCLETILHHPVRSFAYPYGSNTLATIAILSELGFEYACSTQGDAVWPNANQFKLPRLGVRDWDQHEFTHWLSWWMDG